MADVERGSLKEEENQKHCTQQLDKLLNQLPSYTRTIQRQADSLRASNIVNLKTLLTSRERFCVEATEGMNYGLPDA